MSEPVATSSTRPWLIPTLLGAALALLSAWLVVIELAEPRSTLEFRGIRFSNTINSPGERNTVYYYRDRLDWLPRPFKDDFLSPSFYLANIRGIWIGMFLLQVLALVACKRAALTKPWHWAIGPALASLVLLFYPPTSTDIYAYASFGWVLDQGANPYTVVPKSIPTDPYHIFNDWTHITTPYGPIWTWLSYAIVHITGHDPFWTAALFKLVTTLAAFGLAALTWQLAGRFTANRRLRLTAFVLVLWSPILITESAGPVHLDAVMMFFAIAGLLVATGTRARSPRLGLLICLCSALVKPATLPLIALMGLTRFNRADPWPVILKRVTGDVVVVLGAIVLAYLPFLDGDFVDATDKMAHVVFIDRPLHSNPLWMWAFAHIDHVIHLSAILPSDAGQGSRWLAIALFIGVAVILTRSVLAERQNAFGTSEEASYQTNLRFLVWSWAAVTGILGLLPLNAHIWYAIWPMTPLAIVWISDGHHDRPRPPYWLVALQVWIAISFLVYHTLPKHSPPL